jgi:glycosyltransferase involved in cell wall biosynthesis
MRIGIVLHPYGEKKPAGLAEYILNLTKALVEYNTEHEYVIFLKEGHKVMPHFARSNWSVHTLGGGRFWLDKIVDGPEVDVCIFNTPVLPFFRVPKHTVVIALDFAYLHFPASSFKEWCMQKITYSIHALALIKTTCIVAISQATATDMRMQFPFVSLEKVDVVHPGFRNICALKEEDVDADLSERFFIFAGVIKERKNVLNIVKGFIYAKGKYGIPQRLYIAGKGDGSYLQEIQKVIYDTNMQEEIIFLGHATSGQLSRIYKNADALIFPSIVEGFGFPLLEAMSCDLPVLTSQGSSLGEVAGDAALKVNPTSVEDIAIAMRDLSTEEVQKVLREKGRIRAKEFSWQRTANMFTRVYNRIQV